MRFTIKGHLRKFAYGVIRMTPDRYERQQGLWCVGQIIVLESFDGGILREVGTEVKPPKLGYYYDVAWTIPQAIEVAESWMELWRDNKLPHTDRSTGKEPHRKPSPKRRKVRKGKRGR